MAPSLRDFLLRRRPLALIAGGVLLCAIVMRAADYGDAGDLAASLREALAQEVAVDPAGVLLFGPQSGPFRFGPMLFRGREVEGPADLYYVEARVGSDSEVLETRRLRNLTHTSSADEQAPLAAGPDYAVYASKVGDRFDALTVVDLRGEPAATTKGWPARALWQNAITNLQEDGRRQGFGRRRYAIDPPARELQVDVRGEVVHLRIDDKLAQLELRHAEPTQSGERLTLRPADKGMPGTITWVVDTVRNLSFVGPEPIAWLEHRVFGVTDAVQRAWYAMAGGPDTAAEVADELGLEGVDEQIARRRIELAVTDPDLGWPPAAATPVVRNPAEGEGEWIAVADDPYVASYPGAPPAFVTTYLQVDPDRPFTRVYVVAWDPRQVQLRVMTGTREPESATGETGPGRIPRDPQTLERVVAGFNGGFQALHGEFGMKSEGRVYLPPKPWAATVAVFADGQVAMGSWIDPPEGVRQYEEAWAVAQIPEDMAELRQNLTSVVEGDDWNPWRRWYWGAAPQGDDEQAYIDRSGVCLTEEGFMAYFWGKSMGAEELGKAMLAVRCVRGMHLDMNQRHTGFEFYDVFKTGQRPPLATRPRGGREFEVAVEGAPGWKARGRLLARTMSPMRFPRYIRRDGRDFFYLTLKPTLPGPAIDAGTKGAVEFDTRGLPHAGWPHAFARASFGQRPEGRTWLVRIDPSRAIPSPASDPEATRALGYLSGRSHLAAGPLALYAAKQTVGRRWQVGTAADAASDAAAVTALRGSPASAGSQAAIGVDGDGFWVYAERGAGDEQDLMDRLRQAGVEQAIDLPDGVRLAFSIDGRTSGPDAYERSVAIEDALPLCANERPAARVLFPEVQPRPYMHWHRLQDARVRYFRDEGPPRFTATDAGVESP